MFSLPRYGATRAVVIAITCTFFEFFNIPVFWPILVMYFIVLFVITMKRQIKVSNTQLLEQTFQVTRDNFSSSNGHVSVQVTKLLAQNKMWLHLFKDALCVLDEICVC